MTNVHQDIHAYHDERVTLGMGERDEMRERRNANRIRIKAGLNRDHRPAPRRFQSQGSYAMRTMVQDSDKDYDIDDGIYFDIESLRGPRGADKTSLETRTMVCEAVHDERFNKAPEVRENCVRVYYAEGYHVDLPVYRVVKTRGLTGSRTYCELAGATWKRSDPQSVTAWLRDADAARSQGNDSGVGQLRRIVRLLKSFARSRSSWHGRIASGFMITKLVVEQYQPNFREDLALFNTAVAIRDRLVRNLEVDHPTVRGEMLTRGPDDARARFLLEKLEMAIHRLKPLLAANCGRAQALNGWDAFFDSTFFSMRNGQQGSRKTDRTPATTTSAPLVRRDRRTTPSSPVDKRGGERYA